MKLAIASVLVFVIGSIAGAGYLVVRGVSAAGTALTWLEPVVRSSLPPGLAPERIQERLDLALEQAREGRIDGPALRETVLWLPGALLDGKLDDAELSALAAKLDRVIATPPQAES